MAAQSKANNTQITTLTEEIAGHKHTIASLNATATEHRAAIDAHARNFETLHESVQSKDLRITGLSTQNISLLAARSNSLNQAKQIKTLTDHLRTSREAFARLNVKLQTLQMTAATQASTITTLTTSREEERPRNTAPPGDKPWCITRRPNSLQQANAETGHGTPSNQRVFQKAP